MGHILGVLPHILLIVFYAIDALYRRSLPLKVNRNYLIFLFFLMSAFFARFVAMSAGVPGFDMLKTITGGLTFFLPIHGYLIWNFYNVDHEDFDPIQQTIAAFSVFLLANLLALGAGIETQAHGFEGRVNLPFAGGVYDGGNMLAIFCILIFPFVFKTKGMTMGRRFLFLGFFAVILVLLMSINSRLTTVTLLFLIGLFVTRLAYLHRLTFLAAWFMIPFLLSFSLLVYQILSLPIFTSVLKRVSMTDITTYNGRSYLWEKGLNWITSLGDGWLFGNGTNGHASLGLYSEYVMDMDEVGPNDIMLSSDLFALHSHSSMIDIFTAQGFFGILLFAGIFFVMMAYFRKSYNLPVEDQRFYPVAIFLLYLLQVDGFVEPGSMGFTVLALVASRACIRRKYIPRSDDPEEMQGPEEQGEAVADLPDGQKARV